MLKNFTKELCRKFKVRVPCPQVKFFAATPHCSIFLLLGPKTCQLLGNLVIDTRDVKLHHCIYDEVHECEISSLRIQEDCSSLRF